MITEKMTDTASAIQSLRAKVDNFDYVDGADPAARAKAVVEMFKAVKALGRVAGGSHVSAQAAVLFYLRANVGRVISGTELEVVSGISECTRRIRELRALGWRIVCGSAIPQGSVKRSLRRFGITKPLARNEYVLLSARVARKQAA